MKFFYINILIIFFLNTSNQLFASDVIKINNCTENQNLTKNIYFLEDKESKLTFQEILISNAFKKSTNQILNFGVSESTYWIKFTIDIPNECKALSVNINQPSLTNVDFFYVVNSTGNIYSNHIENYNFNTRKHKYIPFIFDIDIPKSEKVTCFIGFKGHSQLVIPIQTGKLESIIQELSTKEMLFAFYGGFLLALVMYNLFIYLTVRDESYLYYVAYIIFICFNQLSICGFTEKYIWPDSSFLIQQSINLTSAFTSISAILFTQNFLKVKSNLPKMYTILNIILILFVIIIILSIFGKIHLGFQLIQINTLFGSLIALYIGFNVAIKGYSPAKYYATAWSILLVGVVIFILKDFEILPYNDFTAYTVQYASGIEVILLSFALGDRINILEKEKQESRAQAILVLEENEKIIREQNVMLETKVKERTQELELANDEISRTLKNLKDAQAQLVHAEKMASLGQLTAGIAHEINNPINFVTSSINPLKRDLDFISQIISSAESFLNEDDKQKRLQDMKTLLDDMDYSYLLEEINMLLNGILEGSTRTSEIVKSLRNFSRLDETDFKKANIIEGLESTLLLLNSSLSDAKIQVKKRFLATPIITCQPGKLNQVYMNIINNAIYATKARKDLSTPGTIDISVTEENELILIKIKDNGIGMSQKTKEKLFEPFFTTKDVGEGTGLGLSIVYNIIEGHKGKIEVNSEEGVGTVFNITLPANL